MNSKIRCLALAAALAGLAGCKGEDPQAVAAAAAQQQAAREAAADKVAAQFDEAIAREQWVMARGYGDILQAEHAGTRAAERVKAQMGGLQEKADAQRQAQRLEQLWTYAEEPVAKGRQLSASLYAKQDLDVDGSGAKPVRLIFRDHPDWGRSAYLVLESGDFDCYRGCRLPVTADGKRSTLPGSRPDTDEAIAMFIDDEKSLWRLAKSSKELAIEFPTKGRGKQTAVFEVGGLDAGRLPGW